MTLRHRIAAVAGLAVAITVLIAAAAVFVAVRAQLHRQIDDALRARAHELTGADERANVGGDPCEGAGTFPAPPTDRDDARLGGAEGYAQFVCADGTVLRPAGAGVGLPVSAQARALARARSDADEAFADVEVRGTRLRVLTIALPSRHGAVQVARPLTEVDHSLRDILLVLAVVAAAGVALAAALGALVAGVALAPVRRFTRRTEEIAGNPDPVERIAVNGDDELARLARSFNAVMYTSPRPSLSKSPMATPIP